MKQKYTITIADVQMNIVTDEDSDAVASIAGVIDRRMREIYLQSGNRCPKTEAALLCALDYCAERNRLQALVSDYEAQLAETDAQGLKEELEALKSENETLTRSLAVAEKEVRVTKANAELNEDKIAILAEKVMNAEAEAKRLAEELEALKAMPAPAVEVEKIAPVIEEVAPVVEEIAPVIEEVIPVVEEIAPVVEETQPVVEEVAPVVEEVELVVEEEPAPVEEAPKTPVAAILEGVEEPPVIELKPLRPAPDEDQLTFDIEEKKVEEKPATMEKEKQKAQKRVRSMFDLITFDNV